MGNIIPKKVLIAPNSFKECSDSVSVSRIIKNAFKNNLSSEIFDGIDFTLVPVSDGGDGFLKVCSQKFDLESLQYKISFPFGNDKRECTVGYSSSLKTVFIESAEVLGLHLIPLQMRNPFNLTSKGMGELLRLIQNDAAERNIAVQKIVIGIGGTGTNDLGIGMMSHFGLELRDENDDLLEPCAYNFHKAKSVPAGHNDFKFEIELIIDVSNPLLGEKGASIVFGPQKGATPMQAKELDDHFARILNMMKIPQEQISDLSGAGGGLAAAFQFFFGAKVKYSKEFINTDLGIDVSSGKYDLIITGEGKVDSQSMMDKGAMVVAGEYADCGKPVYFICGINDNVMPVSPMMKFIELRKYFTSIEESIEKFETGINKACVEIINELKFGLEQ